MSFLIMRFFPNEINARRVAQYLIVFYSVLVVIALVFIFQNIRFNYELENFFPEDNEVIRHYKKHLKQFESEHDLILVSAQSDNGIFQEYFLKGIQQATSTIGNDSLVTGVISPLNLVKFAQSFPAPRAIPFFHPANPSKYTEDSITIFNTSHPVKDFVSFKASAVLIIIKTKPGLNNVIATKILKKVENVFRRNGIKNIRTAGRIKGQQYIVSKMQNEFIYLSGITVLSLCFFLWITFRNVWGVVLPALVVALGLLFTIALMLATHGGIDLISIILPTVLFVVGVSDSVHLLNQFYSELKKGNSIYLAMKGAFRDVGSATFLTAITSAIGFFTLITVTVKPIAMFGVFAAVGIILVYVITFTFLASAIYLLPIQLHERTGAIISQRFLNTLFNGVIKYRWILSLSIIASIYPMIKGVQKIEVNNFFTEELRPNDPHKKDFDFFGSHFGGVRPFEMTLEVTKPQVTLLDFNIIKAQIKLEEYLKMHYGVTNFVSPLQPIRVVNQMNHDGSENAFLVPTDSIELNKIIQNLRQFSSEMNRFILSDNELVGRISGRVPDLGSAVFELKNDSLNHFLKKEIEPLGLKATVTGISEIIDSNNSYLTDNLMEGLIYELLAIAFLMGLLFRNWRIILISIIPNLLPLLFIGACMGWLGIHLNLSSAIIFNIAFGITVDDTIHLLAGYKLELTKGKNKREALRSAYLHSGKAVFMTSIILCSGFLILMLSSFNGIYHTGLLVGITLIVALFSDLVLLPILLGGKNNNEKNKALKSE